MNTAYLSLGSNLGNRFDMLQDAVRMLQEQPELTSDCRFRLFMKQIL